MHLAWMQTKLSRFPWWSAVEYPDLQRGEVVGACILAASTLSIRHPAFTIQHEGLASRRPMGLAKYLASPSSAPESAHHTITPIQKRGEGECDPSPYK